MKRLSALLAVAVSLSAAVACAQTNLSGSGVELTPNASWPVSPNGRARLRFDGSGVQQSVNGGAFSAIGGSGVATIGSSDSSLTFSASTGAVLAAINLAHANTWTATQTLSAVRTPSIDSRSNGEAMSIGATNAATGTIGGASGSGFFNWQSGNALVVSPNTLGFLAATNASVGFQITNGGGGLTSLIAGPSSLAFSTTGTTTFNNVAVAFDGSPGTGQVLKFNGSTWTHANPDAFGTLANGAGWALATITNDFLDLDPRDGQGVHWRQGMSANPNRLGVRNDNVMILGWNVTANGGVIDSTKAHLGMNFEDHWVNEFDDPQSEWYIVAGPPTSVGPGFRPIAVNTSDTTASLTKMMLTAHDLQLGAGVGPSGGQTQIALTDGALDLYSPDTAKHMLLSNSTWSLRGPNVGGAGTKAIFLFDGDPTWNPGTAMRSEGHIIPAGAGVSLGLYADNNAGKALFEDVAAHYGHFITQALGPADYNHVGQLSLLYPAAENTYGNLYVQSADATGVPRWERVATDASGIHPDATEGTLHVAPQITGDANSNQFLSYVPAEGGAAKWGETVYQATNAGSARKNQVHAYGWNVSATGGALVGGEAMQGMSWESFYKPGAGAAVSEVHIIKQTDGGTFLRPFSMEFNRTTGRDTLALSSDAIYIQAPGQGTTWWTFNTADAGEIFCDTVLPAIYWSKNNQTFLNQRNAANNGYIPVIGTNASDNVVLGSASYDTQILGKLLANTIDAASGDLTIAGTTARQGTIGKAAGTHFGVFGWSDLVPANSYGAVSSPDGNQSVVVQDNASGGNVYVFTTNGTVFYGGIVAQSDSVVAPIFKTSTASVGVAGGAGAVIAAAGIGGVGQPTTAAQNSWIKMQDSTGATVWVPAWK